MEAEFNYQEKHNCQKADLLDASEISIFQETIICWTLLQEPQCIRHLRTQCLSNTQGKFAHVLLLVCYNCFKKLAHLF